MTSYEIRKQTLTKLRDNFQAQVDRMNEQIAEIEKQIAEGT